jgi:hypothetical protein
VPEEVRLELEKMRLENTLRKQREESQNDNEWLAEKETSIEKIAGVPFAASRRRLSSSGSVCSSSDKETREERSAVVKVLEPSPTVQLDRTNDDVYANTTKVVRSVIRLNQGLSNIRTCFIAKIRFILQDHSL